MVNGLPNMPETPESLDSMTSAQGGEENEKEKEKNNQIRQTDLSSFFFQKFNIKLLYFCSNSKKTKRKNPFGSDISPTFLSKMQKQTRLLDIWVMLPNR